MTVSLQWSHGVAAVETGVITDNTGAVICLQWSHGVVAVETRGGVNVRAGIGPALQ